MSFLRPVVTGPILAVCVAATVTESVFLLAGAGISGAIYLPTLAMSICACVAHLVGCGLQAVIHEVHEIVDGRLDAFEANNLHAIVTTPLYPKSS